MDIQQLRAFHAAARSASFTEAGQELHLSQSTISQHIKNLEQELGCSLFLRMGRRAYLNDAGKILLGHTERVFQELRSAESAVSMFGTLQRGAVRIGVGATTLIYIMPQILTRFSRRHPQIELVVVTGSTEALMEALAARRIDLAIVMRPINASLSIRFTPILTEELIICLNAKHPLASKDVVDAEDLTRLPFIAFLPDSAMQMAVDSYFESMKIHPRIIMELENIEAIKSLVSVGLGASVVPVCSIRGSTQAPTLKALRVRNFPMERELLLAIPDCESLSIVVESLADQIIRSTSGNSRNAGEEGA